MWSSTNQRIKALISAKNREKERLTRPIHVRRSDLVLSFRSDEGFLIEVPARAMLNDLTPDGFCAYAVTSLTPNVELNITIEHPKRFHLTAKVVWCQYQPSSTHVITSQTYPYRVGLALLWKDAAVEAEFKKFCAQLGDLYVNKKGLFIEEAFMHPTAEGTETVAADAAPVEAVKDPLDVPAPKESDEGAAPSDEQVAAEMAAAKAAEVAAEALKAANTAPTPAPAPVTEETSAASILDALKDAA